jgi:hypothetical protein
MPTVVDISKKAEAVLKSVNADYTFGYGDVFHFGPAFPRTSATDLPDRFTFAGEEFLIEEAVLKLEEERLRWRFEEVQAIYEALENEPGFYSRPLKKNGFLLGLQILTQYVDDIRPQMDHDVLWGPGFDATATMSKEEIILLRLCGWQLDSENECWSW